MAKNFSVALRLLLDSGKYTSGLNNAARATKSFKQQMLSTFAPVAGMAALTATVSKFTREVYAQTKSLDALSASFKTVITNSDELANVYKELNTLATNSGVAIMDLKESYIGFAAASKGTSLEGQQSLDIFKSIVTTMGKLGSSSESTKRALLAVSQMMSKGNVQAEELRGQLGEALPGAFNLMAAAMGVSTQELNKLLKDGKVLAADVLPKLAKQLEKVYGGSYKVDTLVAAQGRFNTAITETIDKIGAGGLFKSLVNGATAFIKVLGGTAKQADYFDPLIQKMQVLVDTMKTLTVVGALAFSATKITAFVKVLTAAATAQRAYQAAQMAATGSSVRARASGAIAGLYNKVAANPNGPFNIPQATVDAQNQRAAAASTAAVADKTRANNALAASNKATAASQALLSSAVQLGVFALITAATVTIAYMWATSDAKKAFDRWRDSINGTKDAIKDLSTVSASSKLILDDLFFTINKNKGAAEGTEGMDSFNSALGEVIARYPEIARLYQDNAGAVEDLEGLQKALNSELERTLALQAKNKRKEEIGTLFGKTAGPATTNILGGITNPSTKAAVQDVLKQLNAAEISAIEAKKAILGLLGQSEWIFTPGGGQFAAGTTTKNPIAAAIEQIGKAAVYSAGQLKDLDDKIKVPLKDAGLSTKQVADKAKVDAAAALKIRLEASEKALEARESAFDKELAALKAAQEKEKVALMEYYAAGLTDEEDYNEELLLESQAYYRKELELLKKYGKDTSEIRQKIAQGELDIQAGRKMETIGTIGTAGALNGIKKKVVQLDSSGNPMSLEEGNKERLEWAKAINDEMKRYGVNIDVAAERITLWGETWTTTMDDISNGMAQLSADLVTFTTDALFQELVNFGDGWKDFGWKALEAVGTFMQQLGAQLVTVALLEGAFQNLMKNPKTWPIALGVGIAAIAAGSAFKAMSAKGVSGGSSAASPANQYVDRGDSKVIFEIQGAKLVGVLDNYKKQTYNSK